MKFLRSNKRVRMAVLLAAITVASTIAVSKRLFAVDVIPFGGQIISVVPCSCSNNYWLEIGPPVGGDLIYQPGATVVYKFGQITRPGPWTRGVYTLGGVCSIPSGKGCAIKPSEGTISIVGTSL